jgi:cytochrome c oxidase subunit 2
MALTIDRAYLEKSILDPGADIVDGYPPAMPSFAGKIPKADMTGIIDFLLGQGGHTTEAKQAQGAAPAGPVSQGEALANKNGCLGCHSTDGSRRVGPSFKDLMGSERTIVKDGKTLQVKADTSYLIRAIREPGAEIVEGYPPAMPPYPGLSDEDIKDLQAWLETLK